MHALVPSSRLYLAPVRDEEAESQRRAKSRHARQTRRSTQGVTLTDLKDAQKLNSRSEESLFDGNVEDRATETKISPRWSNTDEQGNIRSKLQSVAEYTEACCWPSSTITDTNAIRAGGRKWMDENQNLLEEEEQFTVTKPRSRQRGWDESDRAFSEHDRLSRFDSSGENVPDRLGITSSYTRRETRLGSFNKQDQDTTSKDYKKMYGEALQENERLKSRLQDSKQELVNIRSQLDKLAHSQERLEEKSTMLESEKKEKQALEKRVSGMEEEMKVLTELKTDNQRLKDENGALIRVISKLSK
ncbi:protein phosphatase 1 regulatory subunit 12B-like isoform X2 [Corythoichthys intestinalis]|uniref:protein phosphatase 1 regulatory subunit 12B-like isoform X2 n=1 Tax=Corythoichthys intestinalis TaxID=161448 RepID=UPI0025A4FF2A|nr:protein phosphatase 1 regulatory subunit 12B-like isoform X2 [Corythoichthys intestinalis]